MAQQESYLLAIALVFVYTFAMSYFGYWIINKMIPMRVSVHSERVGLDISQHAEHYGFADVSDREIAEYEQYLENKDK